MRITHLLCLLVLAAVSCAQDTNFTVGPQYLITTDPLFLRPIAPPTLSLSEPLPPIRGASTEEATVPENRSEPVILSSQEFFAGVSWGEHTPDEVTARLIVTPTLSFSEQPPTLNATTEEVSARQTQALSARERPAAREVFQRSLPFSVVQAGVTETTDARSLRERGYGVSLGEAASSAKTKPRATRVFTNRDIERLHANSR